MYGVLLLSVIAVTAYFGLIVTLRLGPRQRVYGGMLLANAALAGYAFYELKTSGPVGPAALVGTVSIFVAVFLVIVPPLLRDLTRRCLARERFRAARALIELRELIQPGMGAQEERELLDSIRAVRSGEADEAIDELRARKEQVPSPAMRRQIDERVVMTYLYARRWEDAVAYFEAHFSTELGGASAQIVVEMVRAYCEVGDVERAATLVVRLEEALGTEEPASAMLVARARLLFLSFTGRAEAVDALTTEGGPLARMPESARAFWSGLARLHGGDAEGARQKLQRAVARARGDSRARHIAEAALEQAGEPGAVVPRALPEQVAKLADRLAELSAQAATRQAVRQAPSLRGVSWRKTPVTSALVAVNVLVALAVAIAFGATADVGGLARAGGNLKSAVVIGEWWRLASSMFLHAGLLHLAINMYGLWILGKLVEQIYGPLRLFGLYTFAGLCGSLASLAFGGPMMSVGASGAVFGLLGAATVELALHRDAYPPRWRKSLLGNFLFLIIANVLIGFEGAIDQAAHMGGLVAGGIAAVALSPHAPIAGSRIVRVGSAGLAAVCAVILAYGAIGVATTSYADTMARYPRTVQEVGGLRMEVPSIWQPGGAGDLRDPSMLANLFFERHPTDAPLAVALAARVEDELSRGAFELGFETARVADEVAIAVPPPWEVHELVVEAKMFAGTIRYRAAAFGRRSGEELWLGTLFYPEALADGIEPALARALESAEAIDAGARGARR
jgi:membrane associated rhomboid family serine protease/UPF0716 family protein affecting phage T7 exclusion